MEFIKSIKKTDQKDTRVLSADVDGCGIQFSHLTNLYQKKE
jgi:hypothetical protein